MSPLIEKYYNDNNISKILLKQKETMFDRHKDIATEFEKWIKTNEYVNDNAVCVEGYTAKALAEKSKYLNGEGAFVMLIELRENPEKARKLIEAGFKRK